MNISETPLNEFTLPKEPSKNLRFIKNEEGQREAKQLSDSEIEEMNSEKEKERGIIIVGHGRCIAHMQEEIIHILQHHDVKQKVILIACNEPMFWWYLWPKSMEEQLKEMAQTPIIITAREGDLIEIFLEKEKKPKPYSRFNNNHYTLKPQKSKASKRKFPGTRKK